MSRRLPSSIVVLAPIAVAVVVGGAITAGLLARTDALDVVRHRPGVSAIAFGIVIAGTVVNLALRWLRWQSLCRASGLSLPSRPSLRFWLSFLPASVTPLASGELLRAVVLGRASPKAGRVVAAVWVVERGSDVIALLCIGSVVLGNMLLAGVFAVVGVAGLAIYAHMARRWLGSMNTIAKSGLSVTLALAAWVMPAVGTAIASRLLGGGTGFRHSMAAFTEGTLLGGITLLPGGAGFTGSAVIDRLIADGSSEPIATAVTLLVRAGTVWFALVLGVVVFLMSRHTIATMARGIRTQAHFDELSDEYADEIPAHMRDRVVGRKLDALAEHVGQPGRALDLGCGPGWYAAALERRGTSVVPTDLSYGQLSQARSTIGEPFRGTVADACVLPFADETFDLVYAVNSLHHLPDRDAQAHALDEIVRVLRPGGVFALCEINTENPGFRLYMGYLFPLLRRIDDGTELWLRPSTLPPVGGATWADDTAYQTFLPDFLPRSMIDLLSPLEERLERSRLRGWSAHFQAFLVKDAAPVSASSPR